MNINYFDWSSIREEDTLLTVKGPFKFAKLMWYLTAFRYPLMLIAAFANPMLFIDLLVSGLLLYGWYYRKKWAYYLCLFNVILSSFIFIILEPLIGLGITIAMSIPMFIYYMKRKRLFNIVVYPFNDTTEKFGSALNNTKKKSVKIIKDYKLQDKYDKAKKVTKEKSDKIIKDYELKDKYDKALGITKKAVGNFAKKVGDNLGNDSVPEKLRELKSLLDDGVITEDEFVEKKKDLINKL